MKTAFVLLFLFTSFCFALPRGTTQNPYPDGGIIVGHAPAIELPQHNQSILISHPLDRDNWEPVDTLHFDTILPAGSYLGFQYQQNSHHTMLFTNIGELIPESKTAIQKSPAWLRVDLESVLNKLSVAKQLIWASVINDAVDPYIDEIAFSIAHSSIQYLSSTYANPQLMIENANMIYQVDTNLPYVDIMDYGTSTTNPDYYSTTRYRRMNADSTISYIEVPRDIYYWYIVHPKITDEIPAYIDPSIVESNTSHVNNIAAPPTGKFWRTFLYSVQQDTLPVLSQVLANCQTLRNWNGTPGDAITAIQDWINATISFTSNAERPHQPVRIFQKHFGRCGEHADYTAAAARLALIPCTSIQAISVDHTWNEFWDENWIHWEPVNHSINDPFVYENGWTWSFGSVFETRSDGFLTPITERYSEGIATINIVVLDNQQQPIDGARVLLMVNAAGTLKFDMQGITGNDGICTFPVGENRHFAARVETSIGSLPETGGEYLDLVESTSDGNVYSYQFDISNSMPAANINLIEPAPIDENYRLVTSLNVSKQVLCGVVMWDDIMDVSTRPSVYKTLDIPGDANFILTDSDNIMFYQAVSVADAYNFSGSFSQETGIYHIPSTIDWYGCVDNFNHLSNAQYISGSMRLEQLVVSTDDHLAIDSEFRGFPNYPNPFNPNTEIRFQLPKSNLVELSIYNIKGQKVKTLLNQFMEAGQQKIIWNGTDDTGCSVCSGIYFYRLEAGDKCYIHKMVLLK